jgi:anti-sigma B factor antagonist
VVVDLSECTFLDSTALCILIEANRQLSNARLPIVAAPEARRPFELTGLDRLFAFHSTLDEALNGRAR